ncbi:aspartate aminotransferase [Streptococcus infantarius subsp. infantarius]|nr:aspartate aminotransferase [Streptococcus infantarius subsp. infantarius]
MGGTFGAVQDAATYALLNSQNDRKELRDLYKSRRDLAYNLLKKAGFNIVDSEGTFFLWFRLPRGFSDDVSFVDSLLFEKQVALIPGSTFGKNGEGYLRLSLVSDLVYIEEGIYRLIDFVSENN